MNINENIISILVERAKRIDWRILFNLCLLIRRLNNGLLQLFYGTVTCILLVMCRRNNQKHVHLLPSKKKHPQMNKCVAQMKWKGKLKSICFILFCFFLSETMNKFCDTSRIMTYLLFPYILCNATTVDYNMMTIKLNFI